ncbi:MAG TPA: hypothetical protein VGL99_20655 [Chloroflexota bacterium]
MRNRPGVVALSLQHIHEAFERVSSKTVEAITLGHYPVVKESG